MEWVIVWCGAVWCGVVRCGAVRWVVFAWWCREDIHVDEVALYSVSPFWMADKISKLMLAMAGPDAVVTDGTACVGGNVINFAR